MEEDHLNCGCNMYQLQLFLPIQMGVTRQEGNCLMTTIYWKLGIDDESIVNP